MRKLHNNETTRAWKGRGAKKKEISWKTNQWTFTPFKIMKRSLKVGPEMRRWDWMDGGRRERERWSEKKGRTLAEKLCFADDRMSGSLFKRTMLRMHFGHLKNYFQLLLSLLLVSHTKKQNCSSARFLFCAIAHEKCCAICSRTTNGVFTTHKTFAIEQMRHVCGGNWNGESICLDMNLYVFHEWNMHKQLFFCTFNRIWCLFEVDFNAIIDLR